MYDFASYNSGVIVLVIGLSVVQFREESGDFKLRARLPLNCTTRTNFEIKKSMWTIICTQNVQNVIYHFESRGKTAKEEPI